MAKKQRKTLKGKIISDAMNKTVVVIVSRFSKYPKYEKYVRINKRYKVHDENNEYKKGDKVLIKECRPISKGKKFKVVGKI